MGRDSFHGCFLLAFIALITLNVACVGPRSIVVGSKNFTEQLVLSEMVVLQIEGCAQLPVERRFHLGGTLLAHQAITSGEIDVYPEYSGTALMSVLKEKPSGDAADVFSRVQTAYRERFGIEWLEPLGFENTFAMAIPADLAARYGLRTLSDAVKSGFGFRLGVGYEFEQRDDGLPGLLRTYPLKLKGAPRSMDLGLLYEAIEQGQVDMVAGNSTDGMIATMSLQVLEDDQRFFPPYQAAILVRQDALRDFRGVASCLADLSGRLSEEDIRQANLEVDSRSKSLAAVAASLLGRR